MTTGVLQATVLWDNGVGSNAATNTSVPCDSGPATCGGNQSWVVFDNFTVGPQGWAVSGFDFTDFFVNTAKSNYTNTTWAIWKGDPLQAGSSLMASGTVKASTLTDIGTCANGYCMVQFQFTIPSVLLSSGQYFLGTTNLLSNGGTTARALGSAAGAQYSQLLGWNRSDGTLANGTFTLTGTSTPQAFTNSSFDIVGELVPEPSTWGLMTLAVAGLGILRRRRSS
jgi:hypothetical protein